MPLDPRKLSCRFSHLPLPNPRNDWLNKIFVFDGLTSRVLPVVALPLLEPLCDAFDRVVRVGVDEDRSVNRRNVNSAADGGEFGALVRLLSLCCQGFGDVPR